MNFAPTAARVLANKWIWLVFAIFAVVLILCGRAHAIQFQESLAAAVKNVLPEGWVITHTEQGVIPPDWYSYDKSGVLVEAKNGKDFVRIWFLPLNWIGVRKVPNNAPRTCYWEGILAGDQYKTIAFTSPETLQNNFHNLFRKPSDSSLIIRMNTPSLITSGCNQAMKIFDSKANQADKTAQTIIAQYCKTPEEFTEAAHSLVVLGIPAKTVFLKAAREVNGPDRDCYTGALGLIGGTDSIERLCEIVSDSKVSDHERCYAALALDKHSDHRIGPAVTIAVKQMHDGESLERTLKVLTHTRYNQACSIVLKCFKENVLAKLQAAQTLAALQCRAAVPEIKLLKENFGDFFVQYTQHMNPGYATENYRKQLYEQLELAYLRLTADWGKPGPQIRALVIPPKHAVVGKETELDVYIENISNKPYTHGYDWSGCLKIDGQQADCYGHSEWIDYYVYPGEIDADGSRLTKLFKAPGKHIAQYEGQGCESRPVTFEVTAK